MHPVLFTLGPVTIQSLWFILSLGVIISLIVFLKTCQKNKIPLNIIHRHYTLLAIGGLIGARFWFVIKNHYYFFPDLNPQNLLYVFKVWDHGWSFWGGLVTALILLTIISRQDSNGTKKWWDTLIIPVLTLIIFSSFGNLLDGKAYGNETALPWGITFQNINVKYTVPIHPTQIYAVIYLIAIIFMLKKYRGKLLALTGNAEGTLAAGGLVLYCFSRFIEEFFRGDEAFQIWIFRLPQLLCLVGIAVGLLFFKKHYQKEPIEENPKSQAPNNK